MQTQINTIKYINNEVKSILSNGELEIAEEYVTKAIKYDKKQNLGYEYILGHIYVLKEDNQIVVKYVTDERILFSTYELVK